MILCYIGCGRLAYDMFFLIIIFQSYDALLNNLYYISCKETKKERNFKHFTPFLTMF